MKRFAFVLGAMVLLLAADTAYAQLSMQMSNGWMFTFSGNVNVFLTYEKEGSGGTTVAPFGVVGNSADQTRIQTGLLPAFAVFEAKGKEGNVDLGVTIGFAPEIQCGRGVHDCFGAQIDMRQVFMTVGGTWGQVLAGRQLALYGQQNILNDQTLFGVGATGAGGGAPGDILSTSGTTLGRIGFGYPYPQFVAQLTYSTPASKRGVLSIGVFESSSNAAEVPGPYNKTNVPRLEFEYVYTAKSKSKFWLGGLFQTTENPINGKSATAAGVSGGFRWAGKKASLTGSGYWGQGIGTTLLFLGGSCTTGTCGANGSNDLRSSAGYIGQFTYTAGKATLAASYGVSLLGASDTEKAVRPIPTNFTTANALVSGGLYYQATKSLKLVLELNYATTDNTDAGVCATTPVTFGGCEKNSSFAPAIGMMLFF